MCKWVGSGGKKPFALGSQDALRLFQSDFHAASLNGDRENACTIAFLLCMVNSLILAICQQHPLTSIGRDKSRPYKSKHRGPGAYICVTIDTFSQALFNAANNKFFMTYPKFTLFS